MVLPRLIHRPLAAVATLDQAPSDTGLQKLRRDISAVVLGMICASLSSMSSVIEASTEACRLFLDGPG